MSNSFQILRYRKSDRDEVFAFLRKVYSPLDYNRLISQWDWKYDNNPFNQYPEPDILVLKDTDKIIGMEGAMPLRVSIYGKEHWATNSCDLVIDPNYRGQRLSQQLIGQYIGDHPINFSWLNEISKYVSDPFLTSQYFRLRFFIKLLDVSQVLSKMIGHPKISRWFGLLVAGVRPLIIPFHRRISSDKITITQMGIFDERVDSLWRRVCSDHPVLVVRDRSYLNWRFICRPDARYIIFAAIKGDDLVGFLTLRLCERAGFSLGYLVDFMTEGKDSLPFELLVNGAIDYSRSQHAEIIISLLTTPLYRHVLYRQGFFPWRFGTQGFFRPRVDLPDQALQVFRNPRLWYLTMGDGDLEMSF